MNYWADLHSHSTCSDGSMTPQQLVDFAKQSGLQGLSITDHDTIDSYLTPLQTKGLHLGTGVEFSCEFQGFSIHLLGYDFDPFNDEMHQLCARHRKRREHRNLAILNELQKHRMPVTYEELQAKARGNTLGRPHIAEVMVEKGYVKTVREAFNLYIGEGKKCYVQGNPFQVQEAIDVLHSAHGKAFIAHPQLLPKQLPIDALLKFPFDGIECFYSRMSSKVWVEIATQKGWLMSGGSDFHGTLKGELGSNGVDKETFYKIFENELSRDG